MPGPFYFAYIDAPEPFSAETHLVEDEAIIALTIAQDEGDFASLEIDVKNPGEGLLAPGRMQWCWLSWDSGSEIIPLFTGRLVGVPEQIDGEAVRLLFRARPDDFADLKAALADSLKVLPYWDRVWIAGNLDDLDAVLKAYGARWHIDRTALTLSISDELEGEDGTIEIDAGDHIYENTELSFAEKPKRKVKFSGTLTWAQTGAGTIDLTERISKLFREQKSIYHAPHRLGIITTLTGEGLKGDWPTGGTTFGGGWTVNNDTTIANADKRFYAPYTYDVKYQGFAPDWESSVESITRYFLEARTDYIVKFPVTALKEQTLFDWDADKKRTEILEFTISADIQPLDTGEDDADTSLDITISAADTVTEPDSLGAMPIVDVRRNQYLTTDRGADSVRYALLLCRAALRLAARSCEVKTRVPWSLGVNATLRKNLLLTDRRLPGGAVLGKITGYQMHVSVAEGAYVDITAGCAIGHNGSVAAVEGNGVYAAPGYMAQGYQQMEGATLVVPGLETELAYQTLADFEIDDDGVDLLTLDETNAVQSIDLTGGLSDQIDSVSSAFDPVAALKEYPSRVCLQLAPVAGVSFETTFTPTIEPLPIPQGIDLEAAA